MVLLYKVRHSFSFHPKSPLLKSYLMVPSANCKIQSSLRCDKCRGLGLPATHLAHYQAHVYSAASYSARPFWNSCVFARHILLPLSTSMGGSNISLERCTGHRTFYTRWNTNRPFHHHSDLATRKCHCSSSYHQKSKRIVRHVICCMRRRSYDLVTLLSSHLVPSSQG